MLRIVAGKYRGRKIKQPSKAITRPTMDRVKEAIFNMIQFQVKGRVVLDLFAGSGALAIEAVSRGAVKAIAIDQAPAAIKVINDNVQALGIHNVEVIQSDVVSYVKRARGKAFDLIFIDPPFADYDIYFATFTAILESNILKPQGLIILETKAPQKLKIPQGLVVNKQRKYGIAHVLLIANNI